VGYPILIEETALSELDFIENRQIHRLAWTLKIFSSRKISWARLMVSLSRPKSPNVRQRPLVSNR
jgi:hypothetical protein